MQGVAWILQGIIVGLGATVIGFSLWSALRGQVAPWVPAPRSLIRHHLRQLPLEQGDRLVDLGSGDGRVLAIAKSLGAEPLGLELDPVWRVWTWLRWQGRLPVRGGDALAAPPPTARWIWVYAMTPTLAANRPLSAWLQQARANGSTILLFRFEWPAGGTPTAILPPPPVRWWGPPSWSVYLYGPSREAGQGRASCHDARNPVG